MKVYELIKLLEKADKDADVCFTPNIDDLTIDLPVEEVIYNHTLNIITGSEEKTVLLTCELEHDIE